MTAAALADAKSCRERNVPTVPSTLGQERRINPFMRAVASPSAMSKVLKRIVSQVDGDSPIAAAASAGSECTGDTDADSVSVVGALRKLKDCGFPPTPPAPEDPVHQLYKAEGRL